MTGILLNLTFTATATAILILLIKRLLGNKAAPRFQFLIWIVLAVQILVFPISENMPESRISIRNYVPEAQQVQKGAYTGNTLPDARPQADQAGADTADAAAVANAMNAEETGPSEKDASPEVLTITMPQGRYTEVNHSTKNIIGIVWLTGTVITIALYAAAYARCRRSLRALPVCEDREVLEIFEECKRALGIKKNIAVYKGAESTMLAGILKPAVYIKEDFEKDELKYVLMHELCHYKHKDVLWNLAASVYAAAFWFDPVIWFAFRTFRRDIEVYCDDRAIAAITSGSAAGCRREYARVLVKSAAGSSNFVLATTSFIGGEKEVTARIKRIADSAKPKAVFTVIAVCLAALMLIACTTSALDTSGKNPETEAVSIGGMIMAEVPSDWLYDMRTAGINTDGGDEYYSDTDLPNGGKLFFDKNGNLFAEIYNPSSDIFTEEEWFEGVISSKYPQIDTELGHTAILRHLESRGFTEIKEADTGDTENLTNDGLGGFKTYANYFGFTAVKDGKEYNIAAIHQNFSVFIADSVSDSTESGTNSGSNAVSVPELVKCLASVDDIGTDYLQEAAIADIDEFKLGKYELTDSEYKKYAQMAIGQSIAQFKGMNYPIEMRIKDYKVTGISEITPAESRRLSANPVNGPDVTLGAFYDEPLWNIIYPKAKIFRISYEVTPYMEKYYEEDTNVDVIAVFAVNDYVTGDEAVYADGEAIGDFHFVGLIDETTVNNGELDSFALRILNYWYTDFNPMFPAHYAAQYIGDAAQVGKLVNSLPLHEYIDVTGGTFSDKALVLQTAKEPYGLTVNYNFGDKALDKTDEIAMTPVSTRSRQILSSGLNAYVVGTVYDNITRLFDDIGNLGVLTVNLHYTENGEARTETITMSRSDFNLM